jgi:hypothetical protein
VLTSHAATVEELGMVAVGQLQKLVVKIHIWIRGPATAVAERQLAVSELCMPTARTAGQGGQGWL